MDIAHRIYSCDDHLDLWNLPKDLWERQLPARYRERGPRVVEKAGNDFWVADGKPMGASGSKLMGSYSATARAGIEENCARLYRWTS